MSNVDEQILGSGVVKAVISQRTAISRREGYEEGFRLGRLEGAKQACGKSYNEGYKDGWAECRAEMKQSVLCAIADVKD